MFWWRARVPSLVVAICSDCMGAIDGTQPPPPFRGEGRPAYRQAWVVFLALCAMRYAIL